MGDAIPILLIVFIGIPLAIAAMVYLIVPAFKGIFWFIRHIFQFLFGILADSLRFVGAMIAFVVLSLLTVINVVIGRWSAASHYGRAVKAECHTGSRCLYRVFIGHPARLLCLTPALEGLEKRIPEVMAAAPGADRPGRRLGQFDGYKIVGSLPGGGSGGKLYIAEPSPEKLAAFARTGVGDVQKVVIKCFSLHDGGTLPQIVRENRALPAAKRLGLILEHDLNDERFFYVMKYVPGDSLGIATQRLHAESGGAGLGRQQLGLVIEYGEDILRTLIHYHDGGLWHKDVKPDNIIVSDGQAHLVDFGLITPLRSSMTLTTHGTEYFRDPEMVRMALRGVKVHEVDGAKFDIYATGAVLYSMIENSFPAHGGLSQISKRCPESLRWVVRRAMTEYDKRYETAAAMLADLQAVAGATDPFALKPMDLPSMRGAYVANAPRPDAEVPWEAAAGGASVIAAGLNGTPPPLPAQPPPIPAPEEPAVVGGFGSPRPGSDRRPSSGSVKVTSWWSGKYVLDDAANPSAQPAPGSPARTHSPSAARAPRNPGSSAAEQLVAARARARDARERAHKRMNRGKPDSSPGINVGVVLAVFLFLGVVVLLAGGVLLSGLQHARQSAADNARPAQLSRTGPDGTWMIASDTSTIANRPRAPRPPRSPRLEPVEGAAALFVLRDEVAFGASNRAAVDQQINALGDAGYVLAGSAIAATDPSAQQNNDLIADLRKSVGLAQFGTEQAAAAAREWLDEHDDYSAIVWFGRSDDGKPQAWVLGRRGADPRTVDIVAEALSGKALPAR